MAKATYVVTPSVESNFGKEGSGFDNPKYRDMFKVGLNLVKAEVWAVGVTLLVDYK